MNKIANTRCPGDKPMHAKHSAWNRAVRNLRNLAFGLVAIWLLGAGIASQAAVTVDQQPLVVQAPLAPNIVLMLDDSGSMSSDYMPDWGYIPDTSNDGLRYYGNNGTYYNPNVLYTPPPHADGTSYPDSPGLGNAFRDGFLDQTPSHEVDITNFYGSYPYFETLTATTTTSYAPTLGCNPGDTLSGGQCQHASGVTYNYYNPSGGSRRRGGGRGTNLTCNAGDQLVQVRNGRHRWTYLCQHATYTYSYYAATVPTCPQGGTYDSTQNLCIVPAGYSTANLFTYTTPNGSGGYVRHFVGKTQSDCAVATSQGYDCDYSAATQQSVANWFSYYRTRIEMAKSGIMSSFILLGDSFRIGFGSINGRNNGNLPANVVSYNGKTIATVQSFGDGTAGTQRAAMWDWLAGIQPGNSTPLRSALDAVGKYYQSPQPWETNTTVTTDTGINDNELACRQSYTILTTDGFWNGPSPYVGNVDGTTGSKQTGPNGQSYTYTAAAPYADNYSNTLADVAMKYWVNDLRPSVVNEVTPTPEDPAFWQHMTTFTLGLGFAPEGISPSGTTVDQIFSWANGDTPISGFSWPQPNSNSIYNITDLAHAAVNGHGGYYSATSPQAFTYGLQDALARASERVGTGASLAANSTQLKTGTVAYQANYYTVKWKGDLKALAVDSNTGAIATNATWQAANEMPNWTARNIYTYNPTGSTSSTQYVPFNSLSALSTAQQNALGINATVQQEVLDYLRGDQSLEQSQTNGIFRTRDTVLGDIVDSQPVYVGAPDPNQYYGETFTGSSTYDTFATSNQNRPAEVWVAANDGMLHAFDASTGKETYAFLPGAVITSGVSSLSDPAYGTSSDPHQYFNDGELTVADVYMNGAWHSVLVGTTGRGLAQTVYALDITDPTNVQFLWERSAGDGLANSGYIGEMVGKPVIAQTSDGTWSVLIGNGYNSANGVAALLQFDLATGNLDVHLTGDTNTSNGMAAPSVWIGNPANGVGSTAYAGDLDGHVWSFALQNSSGNKATPSSSGTLLFTAKDSGGNVQPITGGMLVGQDPNSGDRWLFFGTGMYLSVNDLLNNAVQSWYGIIVDSSNSTLVGNLLSQGRASLVQRYIIGQTAGNPTANPAVLPARAITPMPNPSDMTGKSGWYIDLQTPIVSGSATTYLSKGERMVTPNQFQGSVLLGTSRIPQATDLCNPSGTGWIMAVDPWTGTNPASNFFDVNGNGQINAGDSITVNGKTYASAGVGFSSLPNNPIFVGGAMLVSFDNGSTSSLLTSGTSGGVGRVSWRELTTQ